MIEGPLLNEGKMAYGKTHDWDRHGHSVIMFPREELSVCVTEQ